MRLSPTKTTSSAIGAFLLVLVVLLFSYWCLFHAIPYRIGDGSEYVAMFLSWKYFGLPFSTVDAQNLYLEFIKNTDIIGLFDMSPRYIDGAGFSYLKIGETIDYNHFWLFSFLANVIGQLGFGPYQSFVILHAFAVISALFLVSFRQPDRGQHYAFWYFILIFATPLFWFFNKIHVEFLTLVLCFTGFILFHQKRYAGAALLFAVCGTQNVHFSIFAAYALLVLAYQSYNSYRFGDVVLTVLASLIAVLHPAYYFFRFGFVTPQLGGIGADLDPSVMVLRAREIFFSLQLGVLGWLPLCLAAVAIIAVKWRRLRPTERGLVVLYVVVCLIAASATANLNAGGTRYVTRYALWFLALLGMAAAYVRLENLYRIGRSGPSAVAKSDRFLAVVLAVCVIAGGVITITTFLPDRRETYVENSPLSDFVWSTIGPTYWPLYEIYAERETGNSAGPVSYSLIVDKQCRYVGVGPKRQSKLPPYFSPGCFFDVDKIAALAKQRRREAHAGDGPFYFKLSAEDLQDLRTSVTEALATKEERVHGPYFTASLASGWSLSRSGFAWSTGKRVELVFPKEAVEGHGIAFSLHGFHEPRKATIFDGNGMRLDKFKVPPKPFQYCIDVGKVDSPLLRLDWKLSKVTVPRDVRPGSNDVRELGVGIRGWRIVSSCDAPEADLSDYF